MVRSRSVQAAAFEIILEHFIATTEPLARSIKCLEAATTNPGDVYLFWIASIACMKDAFTSKELDIPDDVADQVRGIVNHRWREFFAKNHVYVTTFFLNPGILFLLSSYIINTDLSLVYRTSTIFDNPNAFDTVTGASGTAASMVGLVPTGIRSPKTYLTVAAYINEIARKEVVSGGNPIFVKWQKHPQKFKTALNEQLKAYALGYWPFTMAVGKNQATLDWWKVYRGREGAELLAVSTLRTVHTIHKAMTHHKPGGSNQTILYSAPLHG